MQTFYESFAPKTHNTPSPFYVVFPSYNTLFYTFCFFPAYPKLDLRDVRGEVVDDQIVLARRSSCSARALLFPLQSRNSDAKHVSHD